MIVLTTEADQIIAAIAAGSEHQVVVVSQKDLNRFEQNARGKGRAVGIDKADSPITCGKEVSRYLPETLAQANRARGEEPHPVGQDLLEEWLGVRRCIRNEAIDWPVSPRLENVSGDIAEKACIQRRRRLEGERRH